MQRGTHFVFLGFLKASTKIISVSFTVKRIFTLKYVKYKVMINTHYSRYFGVNKCEYCCLLQNHI